MTCFFPRSFFTIVLTVLFLPFHVTAAPRQVTLFPDSARVTDVLAVPLQPAGNDRFRAVVILPGPAQPDTIRASLPVKLPQRIIDQSWRQVVRQDDARLGDLRRQLQGVKAERISLFAAIQAQEAQIQFWQAQAKLKAKTLEDTDAFSSLLSKSIKKAFQDKLTLEPQLLAAEDRIKTLQGEINRITGQKENLWEVTFLFTGPAARELPLTLDYSLGDCGWAPLYRLDARPRSGVILFTWEADIWQSSGMDWKKVSVRLATLPPRPTLSPPPIPPWIIRPRPSLMTRARSTADRQAKAPDTGAMAASPSVDEPREIRQTTYALWQIGERDIDAGVRQRIKVRDESWPADFLHILRPSLTAQAFLQAEIRLTESRDIPRGQATFLMDGAILAKRPFSFAGREGAFFFGDDPLVIAESHLLSRKAGEKGFITDRQTQEWVWRYDIRNDRSDAILVRVEDPLPQVRDERIKLLLSYDQYPSENKDDVAVWILSVPSRGTISLTSTVKLDAPAEMNLDLGWRR